MKNFWKTLQRDLLHQGKFFDLVSEKVETHTGKIMDPYYRIETGSWVQVVAIDNQGNFVLVEQYRHGAKLKVLEVPGGAIDQGEEPLVAAKRELLEETGYESDEWTLLYESHPNPALQDNKMYSYLAKNSRKTKGQNLDPFEDIEIIIKSKKELLESIDRLEFSNSLASMTIFKYFLGVDNGRT